MVVYTWRRRLYACVCVCVCVESERERERAQRCGGGGRARSELCEEAQPKRAKNQHPSALEMEAVEKELKRAQQKQRELAKSTLGRWVGGEREMQRRAMCCCC